ncbi:MAG TPA: HNH endonuclease signature motif containing protein, partial [Acidimicrobiia bacterium]|nr:HNH endonuclease signature motif containing protein [Acidimicrobiia bacterium]
MNTEKQLCSPVYEVAAHIKELRTSGTPITKELVKELLAAQQALSTECDQILSTYNDSGIWVQDHYLEGNQAIMNETNLSRRSVDQAIGRGKLLKDFPDLAEAIDDQIMTTDHLSALLPLTSKKYYDRLAYDVGLLVENAGALPMPEFSKVITRWKKIVDREREETSSDYQAFQDRYFNIWETPSGYKFEGETDTITGKTIIKAFDDISNQIYNTTAIEDRKNYLKSEQYIDAFGFVCQGYIEHGTIATSHKPNAIVGPTVNAKNKKLRYSTTPALTADIVIDINDLDPNTTTRHFLARNLQTATPIISAHSQTLTEQILCDTTIQVPIRRDDGTYDLGRKVRTAPPHMKKQLVLAQPTCSVPGCRVPSKYCHAHHIKHWAHGGKTSLDNMILLCHRHHTIVHNDKM